MPVRLLDHPLKEGRLRDDAHGAPPELLDGLRYDERLLAVDPDIPGTHEAVGNGLERPP
jgi:hypothetical protein